MPETRGQFHRANFSAAVIVASGKAFVAQHAFYDRHGQSRFPSVLTCQAVRRGVPVVRTALQPAVDWEADRRRFVFWGILLVVTTALGSKAWHLCSRRRAELRQGTTITTAGQSEL